jgi:hypothetical protein
LELLPPLIGKAECADKPGLTHTLSRSRSGRAALRGEQGEQLESKHRENRATGRKMKPNTALRSRYGDMRSNIACSTVAMQRSQEGTCVAW